MSLEAGGGIPCRPNPAAALLVVFVTHVDAFLLCYLVTELLLFTRYCWRVTLFTTLSTQNVFIGWYVVIRRRSGP